MLWARAPARMRAGPRALQKPGRVQWWLRRACAPCSRGAIRAWCCLQPLYPRSPQAPPPALALTFSFALCVAPRLRPAVELQLADDPERQNLQAVVIDSHRPFSMHNVYADVLDQDGEFLEAGDIEKARVLMVHNPDLELEIPDNETTSLALMEEEEEEDEEEEEEE